MQSLSIASPNPMLTSPLQKAGLALVVLTSTFIFWQWQHYGAPTAELVTLLVFAGLVTGLWLFLRRENVDFSRGIDSLAVWQRSLSARGVWGWLLGILLTEFYVCLYWAPEFLGINSSGGPHTGIVALFNPLSQLVQGRPANQWFVYGSLYTFLVLGMGMRFIRKYRHSRYQIIRTLSVMFFQLGFAYILPGLLVMHEQPELYFTYFWPLAYSNATPDTYTWQSQTNIGLWFFGFGLFMFFVATPILTYFFGKRWYCSWVCGCGGLAETAGDPFRHLSDKSLRAWRIERWMIHSVLVFAVGMTALLWINVATGRAVLGESSAFFYKTYSFLIGSAFSGVVGVGFYPLMGSRVWCRFGCPMAAWLGLWQRKASKFRITTNGGQCISCGNCSTHCEMGIDVKSYAQRGEDILRASCVGCGVCSAVCPRGVLRLENA
jgi:ferredoxin-type protein NapH